MHSGVEETSCYGGKGSLDSIADSWAAPQSEKLYKTGNFELLEDFQEWLQDMPSNERVSWAVGSLVLTAGLLFIRMLNLVSMQFTTSPLRARLIKIKRVCLD
ncbi:uncharacterized protein LOC111293682 isoform X2 [Durio zibethinus]|uniref:Uncharacterized protein LOC111293682 isoform X2 n=1 Tax=Durio zibethinus TaxID=66656 RepID=A0A6P5YQ94_DURZI|nr:uncharacterized protein LOC111293682 isoform X2 [Durio zibethinus]